MAITVALALVSASALAERPPAGQQAKVEGLVKAWIGAWQRQDVDGMARLLAAEFLHVNSWESRQTRKELRRSQWISRKRKSMAGYDSVSPAVLGEIEVRALPSGRFLATYLQYACIQYRNGGTYSSKGRMKMTVGRTASGRLLIVRAEFEGIDRQKGSCLSRSVPRQAPSRARGVDRATVNALVQEWVAAWARQSVDGMARLLAPDFVHVNIWESRGTHKELRRRNWARAKRRSMRNYRKHTPWVLGDIEVQALGGATFRARFRQYVCIDYKNGDTYSSVGEMVMTMGRVASGHLRIRRAEFRGTQRQMGSCIRLGGKRPHATASGPRTPARPSTARGGYGIHNSRLESGTKWFVRKFRGKWLEGMGNILGR